MVILLDRSCSMGYGDHWERARAAARQAVRALGPDDRGTLILFSRSAQGVIRSATDRARLLAAINAARVGSGATRYGPALKLAQSILEQSQLPRREAILITDFQKVGWEDAQGIRLPEGAALTPVSVADAKTFNVTVSSLAFACGEGARVLGLGCHVARPSRALNDPRTGFTALSRDP